MSWEDRLYAFGQGASSNLFAHMLYLPQQLNTCLSHCNLGDSSGEVVAKSLFVKLDDLFGDGSRVACRRGEARMGVLSRNVSIFNLGLPWLTRKG